MTTSRRARRGREDVPAARRGHRCGRLPVRRHRRRVRARRSPRTVPHRARHGRQPPEIDDLAGDDFSADLSEERTDLLDVDAIVWFVNDVETDKPKFDEQPVYANLDVHQGGHEVFVEINSTRARPPTGSPCSACPTSSTRWCRSWPRPSTAAAAPSPVPPHRPTADRRLETPVPDSRDHIRRTPSR